MPITKTTQLLCLRLVFASLAIAVAVLAYGFWLFVAHIESHVYAREQADGIVVLTGESSRIRAGVELLEQNYGKRLLISGVNKESQPNHLVNLRESKAALFACCVDMGFEATSTVGNALETDGWTSKHKFKSIVVVTSAYHMPRALIELKREVPNIELKPYAPNVKTQGSVWENTVLFKRYAVEYAKFCVAWVRFQMEG